MNEEEILAKLDHLKQPEPPNAFYLKDLEANKDTGQWVEFVFEKTNSIMYSKNAGMAIHDFDELKKQVVNFKKYSNNHCLAIYIRNLTTLELTESGVI